MQKFVQATNKNEEDVLTIYEHCKLSLSRNNIQQWGTWSDGYPGRNFVRSAIERRELFILETDGTIAGSVVLNEKQSPEWGAIDWSETQGSVLVVHALAVEPAMHGKGLGKMLLGYCETHASSSGYRAIRLDSFSKNDVSNRLYAMHGYSFAGEVFFDEKPEGNKGYWCYEKSL